MYKQYCHVGNTANQCRLGLFQDSVFVGDLEDSKSTSGGTLCVLGSHTFVPISWMCKKQTSVSHSSTESEIISLDTGLRLDGLLALDLWDLMVLVFGNKELLLRLSVTPEKFTGRTIFMSMFNEISWRSKDDKKECFEANAQIVSRYAKKFRAGRCSFLRPRSGEKWSSTSEDSPQGEWDKMAENMLTFAESGHPVFRVTSPLSRGQLKSKGHGKLSIHCCADLEKITTVFRTTISVKQLSLYGKVAEMCEEYATFHDVTGNSWSEGSRVPHSCQA